MTFKALQKIGLALVGTLAFSATPAAAAPSSWWQLSSGARPARIQPGTARNEIQKLTILATSGVYILEEPIATSKGEAIENVTYVELPFNADAAEIQAGLEKLYGAGSVEVGAGPSSAEFLITFKGALADQGIYLTGNDKVHIGQVQLGHGDGEIVILAENLGDATIDAKADPVTITDVLPPGLRELAISASSLDGSLDRASFPCAQPPAAPTCTFPAPYAPAGPFALLAPYDQLEVRVAVVAEPGARTGEENRVTVSGGATPSASLSRPVTISSTVTPFGFEDFRMSLEEERGAPVTQAGSHPFQFTTTVAINEGRATGGLFQSPAVPQAGRLLAQKANAEVAALAKDVYTKLPVGLIGNPTAFPACSLAQFLTYRGVGENLCPSGSTVGVASVTVYDPSTFGQVVFVYPLQTLEPAFGEPARLGFNLVAANQPVILDTSLRSGAGEGALPGQSEDYGIDVNATNISQIAGLSSARVTVWGVPGDSRHDKSRNIPCLQESRGYAFEPQLELPPCRPAEEPHAAAFLTLPTSCSGPMQGSVEGDAWIDPKPQGQGETVLPAEPLPALDGCNHLPFSPTIQAQPTTDSASSPSGLDFNLDFHDEGLTSGTGLAQSQLKNTVVTLPEGFTINPSAGVGLVGCTSADYARETVNSAPGAGCPNESKLGTVEIETPVLTQKIHGSIFIAQPYENPFSSLVALYLVAKNPETGVLIKLAGRVTPNPLTGRLTTTFENNPQLPFSHFNFHFREGQQAPLISPATCGTYATQAQLTPWSDPTTALTDVSQFTITKGFDGGACPSGGVPPFHPGIQAGMLNNNAGSFSPFYLHLTRTDGEQEISGFSTNLPPGLTGNLTGIPFCGEAAIAAARTRTGGEEEANPSCPAASQVGHTLVGTGVGAVLAYVPGKVYLAGPFHGAPFSLVSVTSAKVGPFDLGTVVLRFGLDIDPYTAQVSVSPTTSEPIPTIIDGIVTHVRDIRVYVDRQSFTLNPTSCNPRSIGSTLTASEGGSATVTSPFQAASCANLKFAPKFAVSTSGKTSKQNGASLHVDLTYPQAPTGTYANIAKVKVELPKQLPSRLTTLQKACTNAQFEANPAGCPAPSVIGTAKAVVPNIPEPLAGPVYFVSHGGEAFPSLEVVLQGYGVKVILVGATFISKSGVTSTTFKAIPDNPVNSFELTLPEGKYSALAANGNLCTQKLVMPADFTAQNGMTANYKTSIAVTGCKKTKALNRAQKLKAALKACHRRHNKARRQACERTARKAYGARSLKTSKRKR